jgi:hypothetical protein
VLQTLELFVSLYHGHYHPSPESNRLGVQRPGLPGLDLSSHWDSSETWEVGEQQRVWVCFSMVSPGASLSGGLLLSVVGFLSCSAATAATTDWMLCKTGSFTGNHGSLTTKDPRLGAP